MMNTEKYNEKDIEILSDGISVKGTFFGKKEIANAFNELVLVRTFIDEQSNKSNS